MLHCRKQALKRHQRQESMSLSQKQHRLVIVQSGTHASKFEVMTLH